MQWLRSPEPENKGVFGASPTGEPALALRKIVRAENGGGFRPAPLATPSLSTEEVDALRTVMMAPVPKKLTEATVTNPVLPKGGMNISLTPFQPKPMDLPGRAARGHSPEQLEILRLNKLLAEKDAFFANFERNLHADHQKNLVKTREEALLEGVQGERARLEAEHHKSMEALRQNVRLALQKVSKEKKELFLRFEQDAIQLVLASVHKVFELIPAEIEDSVLPLVRRAVQSLGEAASLTIKVNPHDYLQVNSNTNFWLPLENSAEGIKVCEDERIARGACVVESQHATAEIDPTKILLELETSILATFSSRQKALQLTPESEQG